LKTAGEPLQRHREPVSNVPRELRGEAPSKTFEISSILNKILQTDAVFKQKSEKNGENARQLIEKVNATLEI